MRWRRTTDELRAEGERVGAVRALRILDRLAGRSRRAVGDFEQMPGKIANVVALR